MAIERTWLPKAAMLWADMQRGLYDWGDKKQPMNTDGTYRVVKSQILKDCGVTGSYAGASHRIWGSEEFLGLLEQENRRRDIGVASAIAEVEAVKGPLTLMGEEILGNVEEVFHRKPDKDDPQALSPDQYVKRGLEWYHEALEVEGKLASAKQKSIAEIMEKLSEGNQVTTQMLDTAMDLLHEHRRLQDVKLAKVGTIEFLNG